ncbi:MAG: nuclear transport factor 2 family protein [Solirubrobacteraceae bacterium]
MDRSRATALLDELHRAQNEFYAGGDGAALRELLAPDISWVVSGESPLAGTYHGLDEVFDYFRRRRDIATGTFRMHRRDVLVGDGDRIAALTDGAATIAGRARHWSTVGIYDIVDQGRIGACWLLPFDQREFDSIWSG